MKTATIEFLNRLSEKLGNASDYRIAKELHVSKATVSKWRGGGALGDESAVAVAELLGEDPRFILTAVAAERTNSPKAKALYREIAQKFGKSAAAILVASCASILSLFSPGKSAASTNEAAKNFACVDIDYTNWFRWVVELKYWIDKQLSRAWLSGSANAIA